ncbi:MAG: 50S ribosomal protein L24 [SAR324 cluster bacterium]|nr:50S ribosomal protein L24 [SAR324 cluster bacterium]
MKKLISKKKRNKRTSPTIHVGDKVQVIAGKNKGAVGKVLAVNWKNEKLVVEKVNMVTRHVKPNAQNQQGGLLKSEAPIHYSNVMLYNPKLERGVRVRIQQTESGQKNRVCVKTSSVIE